MNTHGCKDVNNLIGRILGRGKCDKHNITFHMSYHTSICPECAKEKNLCQDCGNPLTEDDKTNG